MPQLHSVMPRQRRNRTGCKAKAIGVRSVTQWLNGSENSSSELHGDAGDKKLDENKMKRFLRRERAAVKYVREGQPRDDGSSPATDPLLAAGVTQKRVGGHCGGGRSRNPRGHFPSPRPPRAAPWRRAGTPAGAAAPPHAARPPPPPPARSPAGWQASRLAVRRASRARASVGCERASESVRLRARARVAMAATAEQLRLAQVGLVARSPEGHAAKGMAIKGQEDLWVEIQANTFRNWVNEHLRGAGAPEVRDLATDLRDGTRLCALVEALQRRPIRPPWIRRPANQHQFLENVAAALAAIAADGVKLVNIGNVDIVNGNLKLVLGLIWSLIVRYQIGRSKFPPKKLMLAWLKAVLPECRVTNFTTDWNSGVFLVANCRRAMEAARRELGVPVVLQPEYLASPHLDELSGMTYLSYFMREGGPGYKATLRWVQSQLPDMHVRNFTRDWNDGTVLCSLVRSLGGPVPGFEQLQAESSHWESNLNKGLQGGRRLGVEPLLRAKDMADTHVEHLGVMAYAAHFQWLPARRAPGERLALSADGHTARVHKPFHFRLELLSQDVDAREVRAEVVAPSGRVSECRISLGGGGGKGSFVPTEVGMHQLTVFNEGEAVRHCPMHVRAVPELSSISFPGMEPCAVGSIVEVLINSNGANTREVDVRAHAPTGRSLACPVREQGGVYSAAFQPDEPGEWRIAVTHGGEHIQGGPFTCFVFDPNGVKDVTGSPYVVRVSGPRGPREKSASPTVRHNATPSPLLQHSASPSPLHHQESSSSWRERSASAQSGGGLYASGGSSPGFASPARLRSSPAEETPLRRRPAASTPLHLHSVEARARSPTLSPPFVKVTPPTPQVTTSTGGYFSDGKPAFPSGDSMI
ncbi:Filamin-A [Gryllus bimaculatus]|nr:Filamin-A [Gryllus bimaculatus]